MDAIAVNPTTTTTASASATAATDAFLTSLHARDLLVISRLTGKPASELNVGSMGDDEEDVDFFDVLQRGIQQQQQRQRSSSEGQKAAHQHTDPDHTDRKVSSRKGRTATAATTAAAASAAPKGRMVSSELLATTPRLPNKAEQSVDFLLRADRDAHLPKPYHLCGNAAMYTEASLARRERLRQNPAVRDALTRFSKLYAPSSASNATTMIPKQAYVDVHGKLTRILRPSMSESQRALLAEEDWQEDIVGSGSSEGEALPWEALQEILFQFVDVWTQSADPAEYLLFLDQLYLKVKEGEEEQQQPNVDGDFTRTENHQ